MVKRIDGKIQVSSTHIDSQGEAMSKGALDSMARQSQERAIWLGIEHDIIFPPLGKAGNSIVEELEDGHYGLFSDFIFYDAKDYSTKEIEYSSEGEDSNFKIEFLDAVLSLSFNPHNLSRYSLKELESIEYNTFLEKSAHGDINLYINLGIFVLTTFGKKYIEGAMEGLGIEPAKMGRRHVSLTKDFILEKLKPIIEKVERASLVSKIRRQRIRVAYRFHINDCEISLVTPFDEREFDANELELGARNIYSTIQTLISNHMDLLETDKIIFAYDKQSYGWNFVFATKNDGAIIISDYGRTYQDAEQRKFVDNKIASLESEDELDA